MPVPLSEQGNDEFWKSATSGYDSQDWARKLSSQLREFIQSQASFLNLSSPPVTDVKVLDYACGPGVVSLALLPYTTQITALDVNPKQVIEYNRRSTGSSFPESLIHAEEGDLFLPNPSDVPQHFTAPEYNNFDYAICSLALHHVDNPQLGVRRLAERVSPTGGRVVIFEFLARDLNALGKDGVISPAEGAASEEERLKMNEEYRLRSHDNSHLQDFQKDFLEKGGQKGIYQGQEHGHHDHGHHHGHGHGHGHDHGHDHGDSAGEGGEKKAHRHGPHGFTVEQMEAWFKDAGLTEVKSVVMEEKLVIMGFGGFEGFMTVGVRNE